VISSEVMKENRVSESIGAVLQF